MLDTPIPKIPVAKRTVPASLATNETEPQLSLPLEPAPDWRAQVPSVSQLTRNIRGHIENSFFDVWVKGEISNFKKPVSGHAYFIIKDSSAQMKAVMFRGALSKIKFQLHDGIEVLIHGAVSVYEARGEYQLVADAVEPVGVGALQLAFEQLRQKLTKEGLFDPKHKKQLPHLPKRIGLITSATGAAVKDILKVLNRRYPNREVLIIPASVQGDKAAPEIVQAIQLAERWNTERPTSPIDVLIIGRGGGSLEDLWPFNEEIVARAIYQCPIPTISAVGHEIDYTIADFVADYRAPTPSAAAEIVVPKKEELANLINQQTVRLKQAIKRPIQQWRLHLSHLSSRLVDPRKRIRDMVDRFRLFESRIQNAMKARLKFCKQRWIGATEKLNTLSPLQVIARGYTLTRTEAGEILRSKHQAPAGSKLMTRVNDGEICSQVLP